MNDLPPGVPPAPEGLFARIIWLFTYAPVIMWVTVILACILGWAAAWVTSADERARIKEIRAEIAELEANYPASE